ncbi:2OG-Fe(II) oxygenase superfamily-domain-containing protein [Hyaloraphidium curvatum]|nr:2OG-Fe(II) oxygenase superfamily-domain-containing protein [Hyaloraphidium curvatum]
MPPKNAKARPKPDAAGRSPSKESPKHANWSFFLICALAAAIGAWWWPTLTTSWSGARTRFPATVHTSGTFVPVPCEPNATQTFPGCSPTRCGRYIEDGFASAAEIATIKGLVERALGYGESTTGTAIYDVASGAVTFKDKFLDVYDAVKRTHAREGTKQATLFTEAEADLLDDIYSRIKRVLVDRFGIAGEVFLTRPSFFSKLSPGKAATQNDVYDEPHVDTEQYGTFAYTGLLYLANFGDDFAGGEFVFLDPDPSGAKTRRSVVEPRAGRLSLFTSAHENLHKVEKVTRGVRMAFTVAFSCNQSHAAGTLTNRGRGK